MGVPDVELDLLSYEKDIDIEEESLLYIRIDRKHGTYIFKYDLGDMVDFIFSSDEFRGMYDLILVCAAEIIKKEKIDFTKYLEDEVE